MIKHLETKLDDFTKLYEYVNNDIWNLKRYLTQSDEEKKKELPYIFGWTFDDFLDDVILDHDKYGEYYDELKDMYDSDEYEAWWDFIERYSEEKDIYKEIDTLFEDWLLKRIKNGADFNQPHNLPTWVFCDFDKIIKKQWLIHLTDYADDIVWKGFKVGMGDMSRLGLTTYYSNSGEKAHGGYNFAYTVDDFSRYGADRHGFKYGKDIIIFRASGVRVYHNSDQEYQTIFFGKDATDIHKIDEQYGDYMVISSKTGNPIYKNEKPINVIKWFIDNYEQYKNVIA